MGSNWYDDGLRRPPRRMPVAMLSARVSALPFARALALDGEDERGGSAVFGGGGKVGAIPMGSGDSTVGDCRPGVGGSSTCGDGLLSRNGLRREVISERQSQTIRTNIISLKHTVDGPIDLHRLSVAHKYILATQFPILFRFTWNQRCIGRQWFGSCCRAKLRRLGRWRL